MNKQVIRKNFSKWNANTKYNYLIKFNGSRADVVSKIDPLLSPISSVTTVRLHRTELTPLVMLEFTRVRLGEVDGSHRTTHVSLSMWITHWWIPQIRLNDRIKEIQISNVNNNFGRRKPQKYYVRFQTYFFMQMVKKCSISRSSREPKA